MTQPNDAQERATTIVESMLARADGAVVALFRGTVFRTDRAHEVELHGSE